MKNLTITQKIAIKWLTTIDSNQAIYLLLKPLHVTLRVLFYALLIGGTFFISKFGLSLTELTKDVSLAIALIPTIGVSFIVFYESIFSLNVPEILKEKREQKQFIKATKAQWWRLRNMKFWVRIILYLFIYIFIQQFLQIASMVAFFETVQAPTQAHINEFINQFQTLLKYFTVAYILMLGTMEYFINKRKAKQCSSQS
ncbi:hypothetical protein [Sulfurospirillum barnesii]|uniref:Uncharacterized protein n=1 Tax=Sulfurospirillum barnesii (strain ATCC 700032 / DSM 10660 / SES-3) TaxID=760154 RepID=I3Y073_SULBS|nr:hypothetical protein [Sulfurospirillum barnesii]AFL69597.1 hypothetical protein Sulba_2327 [Sulfurospirillum barnesii SES-3]